MKRKNLVWLSIIIVMILIFSYRIYYPIKYDTLEVSRKIEDKFDVDWNEIQLSGIELNNKDLYFITFVQEDIVVAKLKKGVFGRFKYLGMSYTDADFVNGVVESKGNKYLLVGGKNNNNEIAKISFSLDNIPYEINISSVNERFFEYIQIDNQTTDEHIFLDNTILYNASGEDITYKFDTSSGGI